MPVTRHHVGALSRFELLAWRDWLVELRPGQWWIPEGDQEAEYQATLAAVEAELRRRPEQLALF